MRLGHVYLPVLFGVLYTAFTAVYFLCGGTDYWGEDRCVWCCVCVVCLVCVACVVCVVCVWCVWCV